VRALVVSDVSPLVVRGGGERALAELATGLHARGHGVRIVCRAPDGVAREALLGDVPVSHFAVSGRSLPALLRGALAAARAAVDAAVAAHGADVLHVHQPLSGLGALTSAAGRRLPSLYTFHSPAPLEYRARQGTTPRHRGGPLGVAGAALLWGIERSALARATRVHVLSRYSERLLRRLYRIGGGRVVRIPGGADLARFAPPVDRDGARRALGLPADRPVLLTVRNLEPRMGLDNLIVALDRARRQAPDALLVVAGTGSQRAALEALVAARELHGHVRFLGFVDEERLPALYGAADAFVLPTRALEGFGLATIEALACGTPVLGTPVGATPELLAPLDPTLLFRDAGPAAIADGLASFVTRSRRDPEAAARLRAACRRHAESYGWPRAVRALELTLAEIAAAGTERAGALAAGPGAVDLPIPAHDTTGSRRAETAGPTDRGASRPAIGPDVQDAFAEPHAPPTGQAPSPDPRAGAGVAGRARGAGHGVASPAAPGSRTSALAAPADSAARRAARANDAGTSRAPGDGSPGAGAARGAVGPGGARPRASLASGAVRARTGRDGATGDEDGCVACGAVEAGRPRRHGPYRVCRRCGTAAREAPPDDGPLRTYYERDYPERFAPAAVSAARARLLAACVERLGLFAGRGWLVDVGCGGGHLLRIAGARGWRAAGTDVAYPACAAAARAGGGAAVLQADAGALPFGDGSVQAVSVVNVLDHLRAPAAALAEARRVLSADGVLLIRVPNGAFHRAAARWLERAGPLAARAGLAGLPVMHLYAFSARGLRRLVEAQGFRVLEVRNSALVADPAPASPARAGRRAWLAGGLALGARAVARATAGRWLLAPSIELYARRERA